MAVLFREGSAKVGKAARFRHRHKRVAGGQIRNGHIVGTDIDELFLFVSSDFELRQGLVIVWKYDKKQTRLGKRAHAYGYFVRMHTIIRVKDK